MVREWKWIWVLLLLLLDAHHKDAIGVRGVDGLFVYFVSKGKGPFEVVGKKTLCK